MCTYLCMHADGGSCYVVLREVRNAERLAILSRSTMRQARLLTKEKQIQLLKVDMALDTFFLFEIIYTFFVGAYIDGVRMF
jgi:hypothetical protein